MIFRTISGSTYEVNTENSRVRRLYGSNAKTGLQPTDGEWKEYLSMTEVVVGHRVIFAWKEPAEEYAQPATITSLVVEIEPDLNKSGN